MKYILDRQDNLHFSLLQQFEASAVAEYLEDKEEEDNELSKYVDELYYTCVKMLIVIR